VVEAEKSAEAFPAYDRSRLVEIGGRQDELAGQPLIVSLLVVVDEVLADCGAQVALTEKASRQSPRLASASRLRFKAWATAEPARAAQEEPPCPSSRSRNSVYNQDGRLFVQDAVAAVVAAGQSVEGMMGPALRVQHDRRP
jgi:hypothetical protein